MKRIFMTIVMAGIFSAVLSQAPVKQNIKLLVDQLPLLVRQAYEKDFGVLPTEGWSAQVETTPDGKRTATKPLYYAYSKREGGKKVEIRFSPTGEVTSVKGLDNPIQQTNDRDSATSDGL